MTASGSSPLPARRRGHMGDSVVRHDAEAKVTGRARFADDVRLPAANWMEVVFAGVPHARLRRLDLARARRMPGVVAILTDADVPDNRYGIVFPDQPVLCGLNSTEAARTARWPGDRLCLVVARTRRQALEAAAAVGAEWDFLPVVSDPATALAPGAPELHDYDARPVPTLARGSNLLCRQNIRHGDWEEALARSPVTVSMRGSTQWQEHAYIETEAGSAWLDDQGRVCVRTGGQWLHDDRHQIAAALQLPEDRVQVSYAAIGGGFGGKEDVHLQVVLALAAWKTGEPVQAAWKRHDSLQHTHKRHPFVFDGILGADRGGRLTALELDILGDAGPYASTSPAVLSNTAVCAAGPYNIPAVCITARLAVTNNPVTGAFRGFGGPQGAFMIESLMNRLACELGMDAAELRRRNVWSDGSLMCTGAPVPPGCQAAEVLEAAVAAANRLPPPDPLTRGWAPGPRRGRGLALAVKNIGFGHGTVDECHAWVELHGGGEVEDVHVGTVGADIGQGAHSAFRQITADLLDVDLERVHLHADSTDDAESSGSASASRLTVYTGAALHGAVRQALAKWEDEERPARGEHVFRTDRTTAMDPETGRGNPFHTLGYCAQVVDVDVDPETGKVQVLQVVSANDVGRAVNPQQIEGQVAGAVAQGLGWALWEDLRVEDGRVLNRGLETYLLPTALDMPPRIVPVIVEDGAPEHPLGVKGMAEMPLLPTAPALASAIRDAVGVHLDDLPFTSERIRRSVAALRGPKRVGNDSCQGP